MTNRMRACVAASLAWVVVAWWASWLLLLPVVGAWGVWAIRWILRGFNIGL